MFALKRKVNYLDGRIMEAILVIRRKDTSHNGQAVHLKKGQPARLSTGPCHGFIRNDGSELSEAIVTRCIRDESTGDGRRQKSLSEECLLHFYDWVINRSPWAFCFITKDVEYIQKSECAVLRVDVPANMLQGALITTRNSWEHTDLVRTWHTLVKEHGISENLAFLACSYIRQSEERVYFRGICSDHLALGPQDMGKEGVEAFLEGRPLVERDNYNKGGEFHGVQAAFIGTGGTMYDTLREKFQTFSLSPAKVNLNPFKKAVKNVTNNREMSVAEFAQFVVREFNFKQGGQYDDFG